LDLDLRTRIPVDRLISGNSQRDKLVLELSVTDGFLADVPETTFQKVERLDAATVRLTLSPANPRPSRMVAASLQRLSDIDSTTLMPLEDVRLQRMAATAAAGETRPAEICRRLEQFVSSKMRRSAFSTSIVPANEVAKTLHGDCTEHAVLLATLMRIKGIPSRLSSGLVHTNQQYGFVGHTWVEALIDDEWVPFDSTTGPKSAATTHIKLRHADFVGRDSDEVDLFLPVLDLVGRTQIHVISDK
jgi:transglutaminase-like putative cysteine protease